MFGTLAGLVLVAMLWGGTNPFIKIASKGLTKVKGKNRLETFSKEFFYLVTNWKYMVPFLLNQSGSVVYVLALQRADLSLVVPVTNSLTFVCTLLAGWALGEERPNKETILGMGCVLAGTTLCWLDKG